MRRLPLLLLLVGCDPVGLDQKVCCYRDSEGRVWTNPSKMNAYEAGRFRLERACHDCAPPDVMVRQEDIRRWCSRIR